MIKKIKIKNYRIFKSLEFEPKAGMNIIVGDNDSGKSTLIEAMTLALNGRLNGRWIGDELHPYLFNKDIVNDFFSKVYNSEEVVPPRIIIEVYFDKEDDPQKIRGTNNTEYEDCPGISLIIEPDEEYKEEFRKYLDNKPPAILPVEYYKVTWKGFDGEPLRRRPKELNVAFIDTRTFQSKAGVDYYTRQMLKNFVNKSEGTKISVAYRQLRHTLTQEVLESVNTKIEKDFNIYRQNVLKLQMDQSSSANWETNVIPQINDIPFAMVGQGQQVLIKMALALHTTSESSNYVIIEEPENHLSHTTLTKVVHMIEELSYDRQTFITTHSSYVLNRLGIDNLYLLYDGNLTTLGQLKEDTINFFKKQSGYDTLRLVLSRKIVLVEGPSDEMIFNRAFYDEYGEYPSEDGIDVMTYGLSYKRALELANALKRPMAVIRDVDNQTPSYWKEKVEDLLEEGVREMFIGDSNAGHTLEPQLISANSKNLKLFKEIVNCPKNEDLEKFMTSNKTDYALRIATSKKNICYPDYIKEAIEFVKSL